MHSEGRELGSYGVTYCNMVVATRPATGFNLLEKWSLESME
jgi:hypothetical protein